MSIRYAGLEEFMNNDKYNQGDVAMAAGAIKSALSRFNTGLEGGIASRSLGYKYEDEAQDILDSAGGYAKRKGDLTDVINFLLEPLQVLVTQISGLSQMIISFTIQLLVLLVHHHLLQLKE